MTDQAKQSPQSMGHTTTFSVRQIKSKYEFFREVNISASLSGGYGPFSGSASFSSYELDEINEDSLSWMVTAKTSYGSFVLQNPTVSFDKGGPLETVNRCGPSYVSEVDRGVVATALFTVYNLDERHHKEIRASMSAGFSTGAFDINGSAKFQEVIKTALQYGSMSIRVYTIGGRGQPGLSALVNTNPTDLDNVKKTLEAYTKDQDTSLAAVVGFRTSGLGKLAGDASIDPDQSSYYFYLERSNDYRLNLIDKLKKVDDLLQKKRDFPSSIVTAADTARDLLKCELSYVESAMQTCRLSFEETRKQLVDGRAKDDRAAVLALTYGLSNNAAGLKVCPAAEIKSATAGIVADKSAAKKPAFVPFGWTSPLRVADASKAQCEGRRDLQRQRLVEMIASAGLAPDQSAAKNSKAKSAKEEKPVVPCVSGCDLEIADDLLENVTSLPTIPFRIQYWFDAGLKSFGSSNLPGLNVHIRDAEPIRTVRFYKGTENKAFGIRSAAGAPTLVIFLPVDIVNDQSVRMEIETVNNNLFVQSLPQIKQLP